MGRLSCAEQLRHPYWQRKRLEVLNKANFRCIECGSGEKTLNVHHVRYVKGRMAWEYDVSELQALCEECHATLHTIRERLDEEIARHESFEYEAIRSYLIGRRGGLIADEGVPPEYVDSEIETDPWAIREYRNGMLAAYFSDLSDEAFGALYELKHVAPDVLGPELIALSARLAKAR